MDHKRADDDCGNDVAGHAKRQQRDQRRAADAVVAGFGCSDAFDFTFAEVILVFGIATRFGITQERRWRCADTGDRAQDDADHAAPQN